MPPGDRAGEDAAACETHVKRRPGSRCGHVDLEVFVTTRVDACRVTQWGNRVLLPRHLKEVANLRDNPLLFRLANCLQILSDHWWSLGVVAICLTIDFMARNWIAASS